MQRMAAQKRKEHLHDLAEANKLLVPAGFPRLTRDYRLGMPDGELALLPDPASLPKHEHATTDFQVMFFPALGAPVNVSEWEDERWLDLLRARIEDLKQQG
jgi:hypothetical protein